MADGTRVLVDLVVVAALVCLIAEEVDGGVLDTAEVLLVLYVLQAVRLVPTPGENVKGDLTADGVAESKDCQYMAKFIARIQNSRKTKIGESSLDCLDKLLPDAVLEVVLLVLVPLLNACVSADRADVDHAVPELDESSALLWDFEIGNVVEDELDELLVRLLTKPVDEAVGGQWDTHAVCGQTVLGEAEVE